MPRRERRHEEEKVSNHAWGNLDVTTTPEYAVLNDERRVLGPYVDLEIAASEMERLSADLRRTGFDPSPLVLAKRDLITAIRTTWTPIEKDAA